MKYFIICLVFLLMNSANAQWAEISETGLQLTEQTSEIIVEADGLSSETHAQTFKVTNESGRNFIALHTIKYLPDSSKVTVLSASTVNGSVETPVNLSTIQERSAGSAQQQALTGIKELVIPFTNLQIGSLVKYKFNLKKTKSILPGLYSASLLYGAEFPEMKGDVTIRSKNDINHVTFDPQKFLSVAETIEDGWTVVRVKLLKPIVRIPKDKNPLVSLQSLPQVQFTTMKSWSTFAQGIASKYEAVLADSNLPPMMQEIVSKAKLKQNDYDKIDIVTSELANQMTYSGNWSSVEQQFFPNTLKKIGSSKIGDCKDFATATVAMLRKLGIHADIALIHRSDPRNPYREVLSEPLNQTLPMPSLPLT
ncbi:MAG: DUF3857 domain-containing protein [Proteobacteria bacterium]|nr:MAG: DUF3857 domain-containing protein [Pseudomonadota bacterium]